MSTRPRSLTDVPSKKLCEIYCRRYTDSGEQQVETLFSDAGDTEDVVYRQKKALKGILSLRDPDNVDTFAELVEMMQFCMTAPDIPKIVTLLAQEHADHLRCILLSRQMAPNLKKLLNAHNNSHNEQMMETFSPYLGYRNRFLSLYPFLET